MICVIRARMTSQVGLTRPDRSLPYCTDERVEPDRRCHQHQVFPSNTPTPRNLILLHAETPANGFGERYIPHLIESRADTKAWELWLYIAA